METYKTVSAKGEGEGMTTQSQCCGAPVNYALNELGAMHPSAYCARCRQVCKEVVVISEEHTMPMPDLARENAELKAKITELEALRKFDDMIIKHLLKQMVGCRKL